MIECAIAAFERVLAMDKDRKVGESSFAVAGKLSEVKEHVDELFARAKIEGDDADWIFSLQLGITMSELKSQGQRDITVAEARRLYKVVNERLTGRPLWYIIGDTSFCGYTIKVDERVLIPRPETEVLAEYAAAEIKDGDRVLDLCTGSGALAVALTKMSGKKIETVASDISEDALSLAKENAEGNEAEITFIRSDLFTDIEGKFDLIVSNPPYIPAEEIEGLQREVKDFEPRLALDGGADGLNYYREIAANVKEHLAEGGKLFLEVGMGQAKDVKAMLEAAGAKCEIICDLAGVERIVKGVF
jgi:release factor glutamine methyltransferase